MKMHDTAPHTEFARLRRLQEVSANTYSLAMLASDMLLSAEESGEPVNYHDVQTLVTAIALLNDGTCAFREEGTQ